VLKFEQKAERFVIYHLLMLNNIFTITVILAVETVGFSMIMRIYISGYSFCIFGGREYF
jgi:hypothetical protein